MIASARTLGVFSVMAPCAVAVSCSKPSIELSFEIREPYRSNVTSVAVQIIEPAIAAPFKCDDLAFQNVDPAVVLLSRVGEINTRDLATPITDIDRFKSKIFWVDGLDESGVRLVTGCAEVGEVSSSEEIVIIAEPVARVAPPEGVSLSMVLGSPPPGAIIIPVRDVLDAPLAGVPTYWSIEGAGGVGSSGRSASDLSGNIRIDPELPTRPGPFVLDVRVRWAERDPVLLSGIIVPRPNTTTLPGRAVDYRTGNVGPNREEGFAAMLTGPAGPRVAIVYSVSGALEVRVSDPIVNASPVLGLIEYGGRGRDRVIVVGPNAWTEVSGDAQLASRPAFQNPPLSTEPEHVLTTGACSGSMPEDAPLVLVEFFEGVIGVYSAEGMRLGETSLENPNDAGLEDIQVAASGCVSDGSGAAVRALALGIGGGGLGIVVLAPRGIDEYLFRGAPRGNALATWLALGRGISFSPELERGERLMFGTQLSVNDIVISRAALRETAQTLELRFEGHDPVPGVPEVTRAGDLDMDGLVDVIALFPREANRRHAVFAVLGREHNGRRISGDVDIGSAALRNPTLLLVDIDADGADDVIIAEVVPPGLGAPESRIEIYPMGG